MLIDNQLIAKLETLARLELADEERQKLKADLEDILRMIEKLDELDTTGVEPLMHLSEVDDATRDDVVGEQLTTEEALRNAPQKHAPYFVVPKVINRS